MFLTVKKISHHKVYKDKFLIPSVVKYDAIFSLFFFHNIKKINPNNKYQG